MTDKQADSVSRIIADLKLKHGSGDTYAPIMRWGELMALLDELEADKKRIAELSASHGKLREVMAGIHNTIRMDGGYTPLAAILNAAKRAYDESSAAAGIGKGE